MQPRQKALKIYDEAVALHDQGKLANAERGYRKAIKLDDKLVEAHSNLGSVLADLGRLKEASHSFRKALNLMPEHPMLMNNLGYVLQLQGQNEKAIDWLKKAIERQPDYAEALLNLGNAYRSMGRSQAAIDCYRRAVNLEPNHAGGHFNLGTLLADLDEIDDAIQCFERCLVLDPGDYQALIGLGKARGARGRLEPAIDAFEKAIAIEPDNPEAHERLGGVLSDHGEIERAVSAIRQALKLAPASARLYQALAKNKTFSEADDDIEAMKTLFRDKHLKDEDKVSLAFALGKAHEDLGDYPASFEFIQCATAINRRSFDYQLADSKQQFEQIKSIFTPAFFESRQNGGLRDETPIFILGMPRSGTSLIEQILASHPEVHGAGELKDLGKVMETARASEPVNNNQIIPPELTSLADERFAELGRKYVSRLRKHSADARFVTDKMPHNFLRIGFIRAILPNARVIHCTRTPMDNCLSIFKTQLRQGHRYANDLGELGAYYRLYLDLMDYWHDLFPSFIHDQSYEALIDSSEAQVRALLDYCNLDWHPGCLEFHRTRRKIKTASNAQVRRPIYRDSVDLWKRYGDALEPLQSALSGE